MEQLVREAEELIVLDEETMMLINTETGEVVGCSDTPPEAEDTVKLAQWIGEKRTDHLAKAAALKAERQLWLDTISARFDSRIKAHETAAQWLAEHWYDRLLQLARELIGDGKRRSVAVGLLSLKLRKSSEKTEVVDADKALAWCKSWYPEAIKVTESLLVSQIPDNAKWSLAGPDTCGMVHHPAGESERLVIE